MQVVVELDDLNAALRQAARYKCRYLQARSKLQAAERALRRAKRNRERDEVRIGELQALVSGLRNENDWLKDLRDNPGLEHQ